MDPKLMWTIVGVAIVALVALWFAWQKRRSDRLRARFGREYEHTVHSMGDVHKAEASLEARTRRVERLHIRPLPREEAERFAAEWKQVQARFVDDPKKAITDADRLVGEVMSMRGYPVGDFEQRVEDISVDHPDVVMNYRAAHDIALQHGRDRASTEDLRQAMVHYRALFRDLLEADRSAVDDATPTTDRSVNEVTTRGRR